MDRIAQFIGRARFVIVGAALTVAACAPTTLNQQTEQQAVRSASSELQRAIAARDPDRVYTMFAPDAVVMISHRPLATGPTALRALVNGIVGAPGPLLTLVPTRIEVASPTVATEYGAYTVSFDGLQGKLLDAGNYVNVWHRIDGRWRIAVHAVVTSSPLP